MEKIVGIDLDLNTGAKLIEFVGECDNQNYVNAQIDATRKKPFQTREWRQKKPFARKQ